MRIVSMKQIKTTLLAFLPSIFIIFSGCSNFGPTRTSSVRFSINASRAAISDTETENLFIDIELQGNYSASQTVAFDADNTATVTFADVPVGAEIYAIAQIYSNTDDEKTILFKGKSEPKIIIEGENLLEIKLQKVTSEEPDEITEDEIQYLPIYVNASTEISEEDADGTLEKPFKTMQSVLDHITNNPDPEANWKILITGEITGTPLGTSGTNSNYGHIEIPADITSEMAKSIWITGATPHSNWLGGTVPNDLDTINRGGNGSNTTLEESLSNISGTAIIISTTVPVKFTNLKITGASGYNGGGILINEGATVSLGDGVLITKNRASNKGGGICNLGTLFIYGSAVIGDKDATAYPPISSTQNISTEVTANYASSGGGIFNGDPNSSTIAGTTIIAKLYLGYKPSADLTPVEETFTGGIYCNGGGSNGGGICNARKSEIYMNSGTLSRNAVDQGGGAIYNWDAGIVKMTGGNIHDNNVHQNSSIVSGGGVHNHGSTSKFIMSGGAIYDNQAWADSGTNGEGGGVFNGGYMFMYGSAVIGQNPESNMNPTPDPATSINHSNKANIGGGIYNSGKSNDQYGRLYIGYEPDTDLTTPIAAEFSGGIYYNYSEQVYFSGSSKYGGGGIYSGANNGYGKFFMSSGTIAYNSTNDCGGGLYGMIATLNGENNGINIHDNNAVNEGNAIYLEASNRHYLSLGGSIEIPAGTDNSHDIYIGINTESFYSHIEIASSLNGDFEAIITPGKYLENAALITLSTSYSASLGDSAVGQLEAESSCFSVTQQTKDDDGNNLTTPVDWKIDSTGKLAIDN